MLRYTVVLTPQLLSIHQLISMHAVAHTTQLHGAGGNPDKESQLSLLWHSCMICSFVAQVRLNSGWGSCNVVHRLEILLFWCGGGSLLSIHHRSVLPSVWRCTRVTGILDSFSCDLQASEPIALSVPERDFIFLASLAVAPKDWALKNILLQGLQMMNFIWSHWDFCNLLSLFARPDQAYLQGLIPYIPYNKMCRRPKTATNARLWACGSHISTPNNKNFPSSHAFVRILVMNTCVHIFVHFGWCIVC